MKGKQPQKSKSKKINFFHYLILYILSQRKKDKKSRKKQTKRRRNRNLRYRIKRSIIFKAFMFKDIHEEKIRPKIKKRFRQ